MNAFYLDDGVHAEIVDPIMVRLWTERLMGQEGRAVDEIFLEVSAVRKLLYIMENFEDGIPIIDGPTSERNYGGST